MESILQDVRLAARALRKSPLFTVLAVITLALGIGATATIYTVVDRVLLRPLPYRAPEELVKVYENNLPRHFDRNIVNPQNFQDWRDRAKSFRGLATYTWSSMVLTDGDVPERVRGRMVTPDLFAVLGAAPALGRTFTDAEGLPKAAPVVILSDGLWRRRYGADPNIVGHTIHSSDGAVIVVGVMPASFRPLGNEEYWNPFQLDPVNRERHGRYSMVIGRLAAGVSVTSAQAEMVGIARQLERENPVMDAGWSATVLPLSDDVVGSSRSMLWMLLGAVLLVLAITCANVGNLMLTRAASRRRETAVRTALGATRWRLARQWLVENVLLAGTGGALGVLLATYGVALLVAADPSNVPRLREITLDWRVIAVSGVVTLAVGVLIGLPAVLQGGNGKLAAALHGESGRTTGGVRAARFRSSLVVVQMSLAVVLLLGAGLLVRSIERLSAVDPGFDPTNVLSVSVQLPQAAYPDVTRQSAFFDALDERLKALPGVQSTGAVSMLPLSGMDAATSYTVVGRPTPPPGQEPVAAIRLAAPGYFSVMRIPLKSGRLFTSLEREKDPPVVIVSEALAKKMWPGESALGRHLKVAWTHADQEPEVVGVVGDIRSAGLDEDARETIYYPSSQENYGSMTVVLRATRDVQALAPAVRTAVRELDRTIPPEDIATMTTWITRSMADRRNPMLLLTIFAVLAVAIAAVGVYAVLSFGVAQRTREIGVRMALGAQPGEVVTMVLGGGLRLALLGIALGAVAGVIASRALEKLLFGVTPGDPLVLGGVSAVLVAVALLATWLPARRASRVDPVVALRYE